MPFGGVVGKGQTHRAGGRDGQQVAVANAMLADAFCSAADKRLAKVPWGQVSICIEFGERTFSWASTTDASYAASRNAYRQCGRPWRDLRVRYSAGCSMASVLPMPVKPTPMRRLAVASIALLQQGARR